MKRIILIIYSIIVTVIALATFVEKTKGTDYADHTIYYSYWFVALWLILSTLSCIYFLKERLQKRLLVFLFHFSFLIILLGAFTSFLSSKRGYLQLKPGDNMTMFIAEGNDSTNYQEMPISIKLTKFEIKYYPGTQSPSDFVNYIHVTDIMTGETFDRTISMNHIFKYKGYRFYQSAYNSSDASSILSVSYDPWGIGITYVGYILYFIFSFGLLVSPNGTFRKLLHHPLLKRTFIIGLLLVPAKTCFATGATLSQNLAKKVACLQVLYNGRIAPLQTLAYEFTEKITGTTSYEGHTAEQILIGWLLFPKEWEEEPIIKFKENNFCNKLGIHSPAKFSSFFTEDGAYRLDDYWERGKSTNNAEESSMSEINEKIQLISMLRQNALLKIFPYTQYNQTTWYAPTDSLPSQIPAIQQLVIKNTIGLLQEAASNHDFCTLDMLIKKLNTYQEKYGGTSIRSDNQIKIETLYNRIPFSTIAYRFNLLMGLTALILVLRKLLLNRLTNLESIGISIIRWSIPAVCLFLILELTMRYLITEQIPMSNGYETMVLLALCIMLITVFVQHKWILIVPFGYLLSGFFLLVASISKMNPQITNIVPVLHSPILSIHVSLIMMAYALLSFTFISAIVALLLHTFIKPAKSNVYMIQMKFVSEIFMYPALVLLGAGIFMGAIWANISWGKYWSWDPKEAWALISFMIYALPLHQKIASLLHRSVIFHLFMIIAFITLLMTYFGVNYYFGGMHSYANN